MAGYLLNLHACRIEKYFLGVPATELRIGSSLISNPGACGLGRDPTGRRFQDVCQQFALLKQL